VKNTTLWSLMTSNSFCLLALGTKLSTLRKISVFILSQVTGQGAAVA